MLFALFTVSLALIACSLGVPIANGTEASCSPVQLVYLAGTDQLGLSFVGEPLAAAITTAIPGTSTYVVPYDTRIEFFSTIADGGALTTTYLIAQAARCPKQRFVISGLSKGAIVVHATFLPSDVKDKILAVLVFGDPLRNLALFWPINSPNVVWAPRDGYNSSYNIASFCNRGDLFCEFGGLSIESHLTYGKDGSTDVAADFVVAKAKAAGLL